MYSRLLQSVASVARPTRFLSTPLASTSQLRRVPWSRVTRPVFACEQRPFATSAAFRQENNDSRPPANPGNPAAPPAPETTEENTLKSAEPRLQITFTCTVEGCGTRSTHEFTKRSYEKGIVLVQCPGCKNRHLIADHLGWFKDGTKEGTLKTVEDLMRAKGESVKRGRLHDGEVIEYAPE